MTDNVIPFSTMKEQVGKKNVIYAPSKWVYPTTIQTEDEFQTSDEIPYGVNPPTPDATSFSTIKKQVRKKGVSKKSKKEPCGLWSGGPNDCWPGRPRPRPIAEWLMLLSIIFASTFFESW